jgi:hypothetical protein
MVGFVLLMALIDSYDSLTPEWLENEFRHIVSKGKSYQYGKLKEKYWIDLVQSTLIDSEKHQSQALSMTRRL